MSGLSPNKNETCLQQKENPGTAAVRRNAAEDPVLIGSRIRAIRKQHALTIRELAKQCRISPNTLSLIENDRTSPSIRTLGQLARGLGVSISTFLDSGPAGEGVVHQRRGQRRITRFASGTIENLGDGMPPLGAEPILVTLETKSARIEEVSHAGREFVYCIEGRVSCYLGDDCYPLTAGDSLLFNAAVPHRWENTHAQPAQLLVLFCPMDARDHPVEQHLNQSFSDPPDL